VVRFGNQELTDQLSGYVVFIKERNKKSVYDEAVNTMQNASTEDEYTSAAIAFKGISGYQDSSDLEKQCYEKVEILHNLHKDNIYNSAKNDMMEDNFERAGELFKSISGWKDADEQIIVCQKEINKRGNKCLIYTIIVLLLLAFGSVWASILWL
jgi:hypothetical protein